MAKKIEKEAVEFDVIADVFCNKCGASCKSELSGDGSEVTMLRQRYVGFTRTDFYGLIEAAVTSGFCSPVFADGRMYRFSLCESCLQALFDTFKIPVHTEVLF